MKNTNPCSTCLHSNHGAERTEPKVNHWEADIEGYKAMHSQAEIAEQQYKRNMRTIQRTGKAEVI